MTRMVSPFDPGKKAIIELIRQPLYDEQALTSATVEQTFFQTGFAGRDFRQTNLETQGQLPVPKFFVIDGIRIVFTENKAKAAKIDDLEDLMYGSFFKFILGGLKDYLVVPTFMVPSGVGIVGMQDQGANTAAAEVLATHGAPVLSNRYILRQHVITIPPQQSFKATISMPALLSSIASTETWVILEGDLAREVL
jgi:hypothetical protein